jgi:RNA polymerase sigma factor (sigma-70 family)
MGRRLLRFGSGGVAPGFVAAREDPSTFADVYVEYHEQVLRFFARRTFDPETAFDLMAETFAELFAHIDAFRGGLVERRSIERLGIPIATLGQVEYERIEDLADLQRVRPQLEQALDQLGSEQREALRLRVLEHREYDDIAQQCGASPQVIRARVSRGLRQLAKSLAEAEPTEPEELLT